MSKHHKNQSGFSLVEGLLVILVLVVISFCGYLVYHFQKTKAPSAASKTTSVSQQKATEEAVVKTQYIVVKDNQKYLEIKEWGVRIPVTSTIDSVVYASGHYDIGGGSSPDDARLGLLSMGSSCSEWADASSAPLGFYVRFTQADVNNETVDQVSPDSTSLHELMKSAVKIPGSDGGYGAYYVAYAKPTSDCTSGEDTAALNAASTAFEDALQGIQSGN